jgi:hypothetical protein
MINLGSLIASHKSKIFLAMRGTPTPFKPPKQKGADPPSGNPLMYLLVGGRAKKEVTFLTTFLKQKQVFGALIRHFFTI